MKLLVALVCVSVVAANVVKSKEQQVLEELRNRQIPKEAEALKGQALADYLNNNQNYFKAKVATRKFLNGVKRVSLPEDVAKNAVTHAEIPDDVIPDSFDSRTAWPQCPSIGNIRDQSACGSCWAFGAAEAISDRTCIASNGDLKLTLSADDIMTCCGFMCGDGCEGGYPIEAWKWWVQTGIVTGGSHEDLTGCKPYPFNECEHHTNATHYQPCPSSIYPTPTCDKSCQTGYDISYSADKHYGKSAYGISSSVASIQKEILTNGPVEVAFDVYADFEQYYGGIYVHKAGSYLGGHAVKAIGWGSENGVPYWLIANSWNTDWGENGYFRIVRGLDECGIESGVVGGLPKL